MHEELKRRSREVWGTGDYGPTGRLLEPASRRLVATLGVTTGHRLLDVAAGHGNCAVAAAQRGASVVATDFSPTMMAVGRARTDAEGLDVDWQEADAADLPFDDDAFDRVTSVFGAIFAPDQEEAAAEAVRVTRPGGSVGLTAWTPDGLTAHALAVAKDYGPPAPAEAPTPFRWGDPDEVRAIFRDLGCQVEMHRRRLTMRYGSWAEWRQASEAHGMAVVARRMMAPERYEEMREKMREVTARYDRGEGDSVVLDADYLEIIVRKR